MSDWIRVKRLVSADGKKIADIEVSNCGLFRFIERSEETEEDYTYMTPTHISGLYATAEAAEAEARIILPWLHDQISN
jgi:hypothetical protein